MSDTGAVRRASSAAAETYDALAAERHSGSQSAELAEAYDAARVQAKTESGGPVQTADEVSAPDEAQSIVERAGFDYAALQAEYNENGGSISAETYDALAAAGITAEAVDAHIAGQEAIAREVRTRLFGIVGGEAQYTDMVSWAAENLSAEQQAAYNAAVNTSDPHQRDLAVRGLYSQYTADVGVTPQLLGGRSGSGSQAGGAFRSMTELTSAMKDPRYATDAAYRSDVAARLSRSNIM